MSNRAGLPLYETRPEPSDPELAALWRDGAGGKPCPQCDGRPVLHLNEAMRAEFRYSVECNGCGRDYPRGLLSYAPKAAEALRLWNGGQFFDFDKMRHVAYADHIANSE